jgi:hypothetical protein
MRAADPPFSRDLAPSAFHLFGKVKTGLKGPTFENEQELSQSVMDALTGISLDELKAVSEHWLPRTDTHIQRAGDDVE